MENAPVISVLASRVLWSKWIAGAFFLLGTCQVAWFVVAAGVNGWRVAAVAGVWLVACVVAWYDTAGAREGVLRWNGQAFLWSDASRVVPVRLALHLDFQRIILVSLRYNSERRIWIWLQVGSTFDQWLMLRRAIVLHASGRRLQPAKQPFSSLS